MTDMQSNKIYNPTHIEEKVIYSAIKNRNLVLFYGLFALSLRYSRTISLGQRLNNFIKRKRWKTT